MKTTTHTILLTVTLTDADEATTTDRLLSITEHLVHDTLTTWDKGSASEGLQPPYMTRLHAEILGPSRGTKVMRYKKDIPYFYGGTRC